MIKRLQRKFVLIAMGSLLAVMVVLVGAINAVNFVQMDRRADRLLELIRHVAEVAIDRGIIHEGAMLVVTAGIPLGKSGDTNMIRIIQA